MLANIGCVLLGAIFGALARFFITNLSSELSHHHGFPYGTLAVNVLGSFIVGYVLMWTTDHTHDYWRLFAATGFCGAFTTFSAFAYESLVYWHDGRIAMFLLNLGANNLACLVAVALGMKAHRAL